METRGMHEQAMQSVYKQSVYKQWRFYMNIFIIYGYICEQSYLFYLIVGFN